MKIALNERERSALQTFLKHFEDAEALSEAEYVVDLYDVEPPLSLDLVLTSEGILVEGAARLSYDEEMDGWYVDTRVEEPGPVLAALRTVGALPA